MTGWFYSPVPYYVLDELPFDTVVYDVMDHLAAFRGAAPDLAARERRLLAAADVVFAGGPSLYEDRRERHHNVHLVPSGVDAGHWTSHPAMQDRTQRGPVLGYVGVIDERVDAALLDDIARRRPDWSIVLVGPVRKVDPQSLPRRPNLHYLGARPYDDLPSIVAGFDVALMPFALNAATRFISPTKALEYMAASRPVVATPVPDVVSQWGGTIEVAQGGRRFVDAVCRVLDEPAERRTARMTAQARFVQAGGWDRIVELMWREVAAVLPEARPRPVLTEPSDRLDGGAQGHAVVVSRERRVRR